MSMREVEWGVDIYTRGIVERENRKGEEILR